MDLLEVFKLYIYVVNTTGWYDYVLQSIPDCPRNYVCDGNGFCVPKQCKNQKDCKSNQRCVHVNVVYGHVVHGQCQDIECR